MKAHDIIRDLNGIQDDAEISFERSVMIIKYPQNKDVAGIRTFCDCPNRFNLPKIPTWENTGLLDLCDHPENECYTCVGATENKACPRGYVR